MTTNILDSINSLPLILQILFWWHVIAFVFAFVDRLLELSTGSSFLEVKLNGRSVIESFVLLCFSLLLIIISIVFSFFLTASLPIWIIFYLVWSIFSYFVSSVAYCLRLTFHPKTLFMLLGLLVNGAIVFTAIHYTKAFGMENWFFIFLLAFSITLVECLLSYYLFEELKEYKNTKFATRKFSFREARAYVSRNVIFKTALIILITCLLY
ncbi:MAG TPA: hypothetical protein DHV62_01240, partial [Elusimicrobia bacterium]|nr:hypothetical protein [Elusimicrobiota bacterium]